MFALALLGTLAMVLIDLITAKPARPFLEDEERAFARYSIYLAAVSIEAYRDSTGRLPARLEDIVADAPGLLYERDGRTYTLRGVAGGDTVSYRKGEDLAPFEAAFNELDLR